MKIKIQKKISLLEALSEAFEDSSKRSLTQWIRQGRVLRRKAILDRSSEELRPGDELNILPRTQTIDKDVRILFQDSSLIVVEKPEGLLSVPKDKHPAPNVLEILRKHFRSRQIFAVHRLDRDASGLLVFARGVKAKEALKGLFEKRKIQREYIAIVEGGLKMESGTWKSTLMEKENYDVSATKNKAKGKLAITHFRRVKKSKSFSYLHIRLETGRKHQIRVHCKDANHPILGDQRYESLTPSPRLFLHAHELIFFHPLTKKKMYFLSPIPRSFVTFGYPA